MAGRVDRLRGQIVVGTRKCLCQHRIGGTKVEHLGGQGAAALEQVLDPRHVNAIAGRGAMTGVPRCVVGLRAQKGDPPGAGRRHPAVESAGDSSTAPAAITRYVGYLPPAATTSPGVGCPPTCSRDDADVVSLSPASSGRSPA